MAVVFLPRPLDILGLQLRLLPLPDLPEDSLEEVPAPLPCLVNGLLLHLVPPLFLPVLVQQIRAQDPQQRLLDGLADRDRFLGHGESVPWRRAQPALRVPPGPDARPLVSFKRSRYVRWRT